MPTEFDLREGLDPTPLPSVSAAHLLQMIRQAVLANNRGMIIYSATEPDVVANPQLTRYVWANTNTDPYVLYAYSANAADWVVTGLGVNSINGDVLLDGSVVVDKLTPGSPGYILRTRLDGTAVEWVPFVLTNQNVNTLLAKGLAGQFLRTSIDASSVQWFTFNLSDFLTPFQIPLIAIDVEGPANTVVAVDPTGSFLTMVDVVTLISSNTFPVNKLVAGSDGDVLQTIGGIVAWRSGSTGVLTFLNPNAVGNPVISQMGHAGVGWTTVNISAITGISAITKAVVVEIVMFNNGGGSGNCYLEMSAQNGVASNYQVAASAQGAVVGGLTVVQAVVPVRVVAGVVTVDYQLVYAGTGVYNTTVKIAGAYS